jgi:peptidoglycan hydrolase-like protein with peptidoglycan-binding domain
MAAAVFVMASGSPAVAQTPGGEARLMPAQLIADASWHGRPIRRPDRGAIQVGAARAGVAAVRLRFGAGYRHPGGSPAVREVQRRLQALGYQAGPVDGLFGPRTRSAVAWFQIKHRVPPTGVVDGATLSVLRFRTDGPHAARAPVSLPPTPAPAPAAPRPSAGHRERSYAQVALFAVGALALALSLGVLAALRASPRTARSPKPAAATPVTAAPQRVIGYAAGRDAHDIARQRHAMELLCAERGWTLASLVKDPRGPASRKRRRPGLTHALAQVAAGGIAQLLVGRPQQLARSPAELAALAQWCSERGVGLVAVDVAPARPPQQGRPGPARPPARIAGASANVPNANVFTGPTPRS